MIKIKNIIPVILISILYFFIIIPQINKSYSPDELNSVRNGINLAANKSAVLYSPPFLKSAQYRDTYTLSPLWKFYILNI